MIDDDGDRLLAMPKGAALLQLPEWPFAEPGALLALNPPLLGRVRGAPSVGTVWTVGIAGGGVVERETVTALGVEAGAAPLVDAAPRVGVMRWMEGVDDALGELVTIGNAAESAPDAAGPLSPGPKSVSTPGPSPADALGVSEGELVASGRSPMSWAVTVGRSELSTTGGLSTGDGSDHSPPTPGASLLSEVGGGWAAPGPEAASLKEADRGVEVLPWGALTTGRLELGDGEDAAGVLGELGVVVGVVVLRWTIGVADAGVLEGVAKEAAASVGRSAVPSVGTSNAGAGLVGPGSVPRETVAVGEGSPSVARRETVGTSGVGVVGVTTIGIAAGGVASVVASVPGAPPSSKGTVVAAPRVGAWSSAILLRVGPTGNDLGEAGAAICSVTAGGSGAGVMSTADEIMGGPSPPRRRAGVAAEASTRGIAGVSVERWTIGAPMGVAPEEPCTEVTESPEEPRVGDSGAETATGSGSAGVGSEAGTGDGSGEAAAGVASTTGKFHGSGVSTEPGPPLSAETGLTERSTGVGDESDHRWTIGRFGVAAADETACTTGRSE